MSRNRFRRAFTVPTTDRSLTANAGSVLIRAAANAVGLGTSIAANMHLSIVALDLSSQQAARQQRGRQRDHRPHQRL